MAATAAIPHVTPHNTNTTAAAAAAAAHLIPGVANARPDCVQVTRLRKLPALVAVDDHIMEEAVFLGEVLPLKLLNIPATLLKDPQGRKQKQHWQCQQGRQG
jgi:hypothetical protein